MVCCNPRTCCALTVPTSFPAPPPSRLSPLPLPSPPPSAPCFSPPSSPSQIGVLDQGWNPDGLYTSATDAALQSDLLALKAMGFNTVRKHQKLETRRW
jgi:hypothetical protein